ncbi:MAG: hypothetical protein ACYT04_83610, partial [Nostoc sp.]
GVSLVRVAGVSLFSASETGEFDGIPVGSSLPFPSLISGRRFQGKLPTGTIGFGVAIGLAVAVDFGVTIGFGVAIGFAVTIGFGVTVGFAVTIGFGVTVGFGVETLCCLKGLLSAL